MIYNIMVRQQLIVARHIHDAQINIHIVTMNMNKPLNSPEALIYMATEYS